MKRRAFLGLVGAVAVSVGAVCVQPVAAGGGPLSRMILNELALTRANLAPTESRTGVRAIHRALGVTVQTADGAQHEIREIAVPIVWSAAEERVGDPRLAADLVRNTLRVHDELLAAAAAGGRLVVSREYEFWPGTIRQADTGMWGVALFTAYAAIPA